MSPTFNTYVLADISTSHITKQDGELLGDKDAPGHIAELVDETGSFYYVNLVDPDWQDDAMKKHGFSDAFIEIFRHLRKQNIPYVRFDADGAEVDGLPTFEW